MMIAWTLALTLTVAASFTENQKRYLSPFDTIQLMKMLFDTEHPYPDCRTLTEQHRNLLGDNSPVTGSPASPSPNFVFVEWYQGCMDQLVSHVWSSSMSENATEKGWPFFPKGLISSRDSIYNLTDQQRKSVLNHQIEYFLGGPEVLQDYGLISHDTLLVKMEEIWLSEDPIYSVPKVTRYLLLRDEFLSY